MSISGCITRKPPSNAELRAAENKLFEDINLDRRLSEIPGLARNARLDSASRDLAVDMLTGTGEVDVFMEIIDKHRLQSAMSTAQLGVFFREMPPKAKPLPDEFMRELLPSDREIIFDPIYTDAGVAAEEIDGSIAVYILMAQFADTASDGSAVPTLTGDLWPKDSLKSRELALFNLVNEARDSADRSILVFDNQLSALARTYAEKMFAMGFFDHEEPTGRDLRDRLIASNMDKYSTWGENLASLLNPMNPVQEAHSGLMDSPGHKENIMYRWFTHLGVGVATDGDWWIFVQLFAKKKGTE